MKDHVRRFFAKSKAMSWSNALVCAAAVVLCGMNLSFAEKPEIDFSGYTAYQSGEIVRGMYGPNWTPLDHQWQNFMFGGFDLTATVDKRLQIVAGFECEIARTVLTLQTIAKYAQDLDSYNSFFKFYPDQLRGTYSFGDLEDPYLKVTLGYFKYTYNHDAKSLGEYLFRATSYPGYIINNFASVYARLAGLSLEYKPMRGLTIDGLLTSEMSYPVGDITPTIEASYDMGGSEKHPLIEVGAGISFSRLLSVNKALTSGNYSQNEYYFFDTTYGAVDTTITLDSSAKPSFASTKIMARFSFDPKQFFGAPGIFGDEDLKIYGEGCVLGTKNYSGIYNNIWKRIPIMLGFNVPTFKFLDVFSAEVEWYNSQYSNNYHQTYVNFPPLPQPLGGFEPKPYKWYWDVYAAKTITHGLQVMGDVGRTHYFTTGNMQYYRDTREECPSRGDWQFTLRAQYSF
jgi:hypothetical protein